MLDEPDRQLVLDVLHDRRYAEFAADEIRAAIAADPKVANRLSMWARRLVGEALSQAQRVAGRAGGAHRADRRARRRPGGVQALFRRLTTAHTARMAAVGLNN